MNRDRLLLCRPQGGLNDILCQIERACRYAERFDRTVFVDTDYPRTRYFRDSFSNYFVSAQDRLVLNPDEIRDRMEGLEVFPDFVAGRVNSYDTLFNWDIMSLVDRETGRPISFEFDKDFSQRLLIHHAPGGGTISIQALSRMRVRAAIIGVLRRRLDLIGSEYAAVHVRNTDYKTEYGPWIEQLKGKIRGPVFVATANRGTISHFKAAFGEELVYSFARLPQEAEQPIHHIGDRAEAYERNSDAIVDLLMSALSKQLFLFKVVQNRLGVSYRGSVGSPHI